MSDRKVWLISQGEYSYYSVRAVADSEEAAQRLADVLNGSHGAHWDRCEVSESVPFVTEDSDLEIVDELTIWCSLQLHDDGTITEIRPPDERHATEPRCMSDATKCQVRISPRYSERSALQFSVVGYDHERVRKVMSERRARYLATAAEWPGPVHPSAPMVPTIENDPDA